MYKFNCTFVMYKFNVIIVSCIVNPMNVVSIPTDYNGAKMRVCEYKVSAVHKGKQK